MLRIVSRLAHPLESVLIERRKAPRRAIGDICDGLGVLVGLVHEKRSLGLLEGLRRSRAGTASGS